MTQTKSKVIGIWKRTDRNEQITIYCDKVEVSPKHSMPKYEFKYVDPKNFKILMINPSTGQKISINLKILSNNDLKIYFDENLPRAPKPVIYKPVQYSKHTACSKPMKISPTLIWIISIIILLIIIIGLSIAIGVCINKKKKTNIKKIKM